MADLPFPHLGPNFEGNTGNFMNVGGPDPGYEKAWKTYTDTYGSTGKLPGRSLSAFSEQWDRGIKSDFKSPQEWLGMINRGEVKPLGGPKDDESFFAWKRRVFEDPSRLSAKLYSTGGFGSVPEFAQEIFNEQSTNPGNVLPASEYMKTDEYRSAFGNPQFPTAPPPRPEKQMLPWAKPGMPIDWEQPLSTDTKTAPFETNSMTLAHKFAQKLRDAYGLMDYMDSTGRPMQEPLFGEEWNQHLDIFKDVLGSLMDRSKYFYDLAKFQGRDAQAYRPAYDSRKTDYDYLMRYMNSRR